MKTVSKKIRICRWGDGLGFRVPLDLVVKLRIREGSSVDLRVDRGRIVISPARTDYALKNLLVGMTPQAMREAFDCGEDEGRELVP